MSWDFNQKIIMIIRDNDYHYDYEVRVPNFSQLNKMILSFIIVPFLLLFYDYTAYVIFIENSCGYWLKKTHILEALRKKEKYKREMCS